MPSAVMLGSSHSRPEILGWSKPTMLGEISFPAFWPAIGIASAAASAYHGVKRNHGSVWWGIAWFGLGALFPIITPVIAVAQGYAKPER